MTASQQQAAELSPHRVLVGFDGSPAATAAIEVGALLLPGATAWIAHLWTPPFASPALRQRLWAEVSSLDELSEAIEREGSHEAARLTRNGVAIARAAGWQAEPVVRRSFGGEGLRFARLAEELGPDLVVVGSRGLGGAAAVLGSVSDLVVHYSPVPVLVVPHPLPAAERDAAVHGPVIVGWDGSAGARDALATAERMFPDRELVAATVDVEPAGEPAAAPPRAGERRPRTLRLPSRGLGRAESARGVAAALAECARHHRAGAIVLGSRGRSAVREILLGSVAMATLHHAQLPVLVVPPAGRAGGLPT